MSRINELKIVKIAYKSSPYALGIITFFISIIPEKTFLAYKFLSTFSNEINVAVNRLICCGLIFILTAIVAGIYLKYKKSICVYGEGYAIEIKYGDLFEMHDCKKVVSFDECFTTVIGEAPSEIKTKSICGQYLTKHPITDEEITKLIEKVNLKPLPTKSSYKKQIRYESGKIIPKDDYLLMAFAKLDKDGLGILTYEEFLECLSVLWKEINKYYSYTDVCIPILGAGVTRIGDTLLTQQELLNIIIESYKLSAHKIKNPHKLRIICKESKDFSLFNFIV